MKIYTIGVYGFTEQDFFNKLIENRIDTFFDIRRRRGVRGSEYSFVNSNRLQTKLAEMNIRYSHILELAPTIEIREKQKTEDILKGEHKRDRNKLGAVFIAEFEKQIIGKFDFDKFVDELDEIGANRIVLFCVERNAEACHRYIIAKEINKRYKYEITHL
jgi:uncharacterized protein (DUF488 family)